MVTVVGVLKLNVGSGRWDFCESDATLAHVEYVGFLRLMYFSSDRDPMVAREE